MRAMDKQIDPAILNRSMICAVFITYNPDTDFYQRLERVHNQVGDTIIVDNGSEHTFIALLHQISDEMGINLILNSKNLGVSRALNQGVSFAYQNGYRWVLTMDQDSLVKDNMIEILSLIFNHLQPSNSIGIIGSNYSDKYGRYLKPKIKTTDDSWIVRKAVITSGSLMSIRAFIEVGGFNENLFIDQVDKDYCLRLRKQGYTVCMSIQPLMIHSIGDITQHTVLGFHLYTLNHQAFRRYYIARNRIYLAKKYFFSETIFIIREFYQMGRDVIAILLLEKDKAQKLRFLYCGLLDGILGKMGPMIK